MSNTQTEQVPEGYLKDAKGHLVPLDMVKPIDQQRTETVQEIVVKALALQEQMREFKVWAMSEIEAFVDISALEYGVEMGGAKGNITLTSFSGDYKVQRSVAEHISFDERLQVAKELIDKCINRWAEGARSEIRVLVQDAFQTDKAGKISTARVLGLKRLDINDTEWLQAMQAINDSIQVTGSKTYVRIYKRVGMTDQFEQISLDIAAV